MIHSLKIYAIKGISDGNLEFETIKNQIPEDIHKFTKDFIRFFNADENIEDKKYSPYNLLTNFENNKNNLLDLSIEYNVLEVAKYLHNNGAEIYDIHLPELIEFLDLDVIKFVVKDCKRGAGENELIAAVKRGDQDIIEFLVDDCEVKVSLNMVLIMLKNHDLYDMEQIIYINENYSFGISQSLLNYANKHKNIKFIEYIKKTEGLIPNNEYHSDDSFYEEFDKSNEYDDN